MPSKSRAALDANHLDILRLWEIHEDVAGAGPGRKHGVEILNRAAIVFVCACWEAYVEDATLELYDTLHGQRRLPPGLPADPTKARNRASHLHTPFADKVVALVRDVVGLTNVSHSWYWQNMPYDRAAAKLDDYITDRCQVAHRVTGSLPTPKFAATDFLYHTKSLADCTDYALCDHGHTLLGRAPW